MVELVITQCKEKPSRVFANTSVLFQSILNLILNARRFSKPNSSIEVKIRFSTLKNLEPQLRIPQQVVETDRTSSFIEFAIVDEGEGFSPHAIEALKKLTSYSSKKADGNPHGIGLLISIQNTLDQSGIFTISSRRDRKPGSEVAIRLPSKRY